MTTLDENTGAGTEADDHHASAHGRRPLPGARISEK